MLKRRWPENLKERDYLENLGIEERAVTKMDLKETGCEHMG
jgi:hypothetical protein